MSEQSLTITYSGNAAATADQWLNLVQRPVSTTTLRASDLHTMLAMVKSGTSAKAYKPRACEAYVLGSMVYCDLAAYVWPSALGMAYHLSAELLTILAPQRVQVEREFDLVIGQTDSVDLPCIATDLTATWQTPCYNRYGAVVDPPSMSIHATGIRFGAEIFGVLRIRCLAHGWLYPLQFSMPKSAAETITNLRPTLTATWGSGDTAQSTSIDIALPACLTALLAACDDGTTYRERAFGSATEDEGLVAVVYYTPCSGRVLQVRKELP